MGYTPYVPQKQADNGHHLVVIPENDVHGQVGQIQPGAPGVGQNMGERKKRRKSFGNSTQNVIQRGANIEVHPKVAGIMQN